MSVNGTTRTIWPNPGFNSITLLMFIWSGAVIFCLIMMLVKRQVARLRARSKHTPHYPIGEDAPKALHLEIMRRLNTVPMIKHEPRLWTHKTQEIKTAKVRDTSTYEWRMRAVDNVVFLDEELVFLDPELVRLPGDSLRLFLMDLIHKHYLEDSFVPVIQDFCDRYDHARFGVDPFLEAEFNQYMSLLDRLIVALRTTHAIVSMPPQKRFYSSHGVAAHVVGGKAKGADVDSLSSFRNKRRVVQSAASTLIRNVMTRSKSDPADLANPADLATLTNQFVRFRTKRSPSSIEEETQI